MNPELALDDQRLTSETIDCISLYQPWASWVAWGWKTIETRMHSRFACLAGKRVAIHAAKKYDTAAPWAARDFLTLAQVTKLPSNAFPRGSILCTVSVYEHRRLTRADSRASLIECDSRRFGLILGDVRELPEPPPYRGEMGIFQVPRALVADAL